MKAKEYAEKYLQSDEKEKTIVEIARLFLLEIESLSNARNAKFDKALIPICKELNNKWIKFAEIVNKKFPITQPISYFGFKNLISKAFPELFVLWVSAY
jgi:hypothetical protein